MHLYVHIPFCVAKCRYCAFYSESIAPGDDYVDLLERELDMRLAQFPCPPPIETVYFGGGTPSLLAARQIARLCAFVNRAAKCGGAPIAEWTMECNPRTLTQEKARVMREGGVTRISIGAQSFRDSTLRALGRIHSAADTRDALKIARAAGFRSIGLDLIAGAPNENPRDFESSLGEAVMYEPDHVSVYALTVEPGTPLQRAVATGELAMPADDAMMDSIRTAEDSLARAGIIRYEISNYAKPGCECKHNMAVWRGYDYLGVGPAAASRIGLLRRTNEPSLERWKTALAQFSLPPADEEALSREDDRAERFITALRLREGIDLSHIGQSAIDALITNGLITPAAGSKYRLTQRGCEVADSVASFLLSIK